MSKYIEWTNSYIESIESAFSDLNELILTLEDQERIARLERFRDRKREAYNNILDDLGAVNDLLSELDEDLSSYPQ